MQTRTLEHLAQELALKHENGMSWKSCSLACGVLMKDGRPDPGLAYRIAKQGYDPRLPATRLRLHLPPTCYTCGQHVKYVREIPPWLEQAVRFLKEQEENEMTTVYGRKIIEAMKMPPQTAKEQLDEFLNNAHLRHWRKYAPNWCKLHEKNLREAAKKSAPK